MAEESAAIENHNIENVFKKSWRGILFAVLTGAAGYGINLTTKSSLADPLLAAMVIGIITRSIIGERSRLKPGFVYAPVIFIPIGIIFYAVKNLNFIKVADVEASVLVLLACIVLVYFAVILALGTLLGQKKEITYLTATGSAICGASAIVITSPAVEAEPDDVSISLLSITLAALGGLVILLPFVSILFDISNKTYGLLSGSVLQFTGFVKTAALNVPYLTEEISGKELASLALSVKAVRYLGLLIAIPLFASLVKQRLYVPWILWAFLASGLIGTGVYMIDRAFYSNTLVPLIKPVYNLFWSIAMAGVGLNADIKRLLTNNGAKALVMAFAGFLAAVITFFIGFHIIRMF